MRNTKKLFTFMLCMILCLATVLGLTGCGRKNNTTVPTETVYEDGTVLGEGAKTFTFTVVNTAGEEVTLEIHTDKETVGEALVELGLVSGEESDYGLYVKTVNGETVDYDKDGKYWAFYINGEYAMTSVDATAVTEGDSYTFKVE